MTDSLAEIRDHVEVFEQTASTHDWRTAKCRLETRAAADLRFLLDDIARHQIGHISRAGQFEVEDL